MAGSDPEKLMIKADKLTKLSFTRWNADWRVQLFYTSGPVRILFQYFNFNAQELTKNPEKAKLAFEKASKGQEMLS
ncbi:hypothetical protein Dimus_015524, partial [Dionaea muscipula]